MDPYVAFCVDKYKPFPFEAALFARDADFAGCHFAQGFKVPEGPFKGRLYFGHHLKGQLGNAFVPHGFALVYDKTRAIAHFGSFKTGKEFGPQRVIRSLP